MMIKILMLDISDPSMDGSDDNIPAIRCRIFCWKKVFLIKDGNEINIKYNQDWAESN